MPELRCTVRGCERPLAREGDALACPRGHAFDRAREGYWNLLQPQDRRSRAAGDRDEATQARRRWLARGFAGDLVAAIASRVGALRLREGAVAIDVGCGEGTMTATILGSRGLDACGIDLSAGAIRLAARLAPALTWIVANADRGLPFADASVDLALSIFGRRPAAMLHRALRPSGTLIVAVPAEDDLIELRAAARGREGAGAGGADAAAELVPYFVVTREDASRRRIRHDRSAIEDALSMSYRGARRSERTRLAGVSQLDVTVSARILTLVPRGGLR
jgi:23S rRNA (guanine745-N1)-methyltransferase